MELDQDEFEYTKELNTGEIRKKDITECTKKELLIRCTFDEQYIKVLENKLKDLSKNERDER